MKLITDLPPQEAFAKFYAFRHAAADYIRKTGFLEACKRPAGVPTLPENATPQQREDWEKAKADLRQQNYRRNIESMMQIAMEKYPEDTVAMLDCLIVPGDNPTTAEDYLRALELLFCNETVSNFFIRSKDAVPTTTVG